MDYSWGEFLKKKKPLLEFIIVVVLLLILLLFLPYYFNHVIGPKAGWKLQDWFLKWVAPRDFSKEIFFLIYIAIVIVLTSAIKRPIMLLLGLESYLVITCLRMITMYFITLEPPEGIIPLHDPIIDRYAYGGTQFEKDLFFSGHIATLTLLSMLEQRPWIKLLIILITAAVAILILIQRVHYSIDMIAALLITYLVVRLLGSRLLVRNLHKSEG